MRSMNVLSIRSQKGSKGGTQKGYRGQYAYLQFLKQVLTGHNVSFKNNYYNRRQVDIVVEDTHGKPLRVYEVTNYANTTWMSRPRADRYIRSLNSWKTLYPNIYRAIVISYPYAVDKIQGKRNSKGYTKGVREMFEDEGIEIIVFKEIP